MKIPKINWIPFDRNNQPIDLFDDESFLILLREDDYNRGATPYGSYIDDFWDTVNDWREGQRVEVVAYARFPSYLKESDLIDV